MERSRTNHARLWAAIDAIAARHGLSPSGLARRAGLDATAFNKSKRLTTDGRPRWPSTESIDKILAATGCDLVELVHLIDARALRRRDDLRRPEGLAVGYPGFHDDGGGDRAGGATGRLSLEVADHGMLPIYRKGDVLIVSPDAVVEPGDRVVLRIDQGALEARIYLGRESTGFALAALTGGDRHVVADDRVSGFARILWASQ